jgi:DNA-binding NtrC family response regulator
MRQKILVVDDDVDDRTDLESLLIAHNFEVSLAENGEQAFSAIIRQENTKHPFDLLITDVEMPLVGGVELVDLLHFEKTWLPAILVSGSIRPEVRGRLASYENLNFMEKPVDELELLNKVKLLLESRALSI